jgi:hypothetical protein
MADMELIDGELLVVMAETGDSLAAGVAMLIERMPVHPVEVLDMQYSVLEMWIL